MFAPSGTALDAVVNTQGKISFYEADILVVMEKYPSVETGTHNPKQSKGSTEIPGYGRRLYRERECTG